LNTGIAIFFILDPSQHIYNAIYTEERAQENGHKPAADRLAGSVWEIWGTNLGIGWTARQGIMERRFLKKQGHSIAI
jgi:hypothetical protein